MFEELRDLFVFREVLWNLTTQQLKVRYRRSALGFLWTLLNPLLTMLILTVVFSNIMRIPQEDYVVYLFSGLVPWVFFSQSIEHGKSIFITNDGFLRRIYVPKILFPISVVLSNLVNFLLSIVVIFVIGQLFFNFSLSPALLFLPISIIILVMFTVSFTIIFAVLNVFYRDFSHLTSLLLLLVFYGSPIIYFADMLPEKYAFIFNLNPMLHILALFHAPIYFHQVPSAMTIIISVTITSFSFLVSYFYLSVNRYNVVYRL